MFTNRVLFLFISISLVFALPTSRSHLVVREQINGPPPNFVSNGPADPSTMMTLRLALTSNNRQVLEETLLNVSTPGNSNYGNFLSKEEVNALAAPSADTQAAVNEWLSGNDIKVTNTSSSGDRIDIRVNVTQADKLLDAQYDVYTDQTSGTQTIRTLSYSLPKSVADHVRAIHPTTDFPPPSKSRASFVSRSKKPAAVGTPRSLFSRQSNNSVPNCNADAINPTCLQSLYGLPPTVGNQTASRMGVSGFQQQFAQVDDLSIFLQNFRFDLDPTITFSLQTIDGGENIQNISQAGFEANLDIQYTVGVAGGVPVTFISVGQDNHDSLDGFIDLLEAVAAEDDPPQVLTTSYDLNENTVSTSLAHVLCDAAMKLGLLGVSVIFSSGDGGVSGIEPQAQCDNGFVPTFPSSCPFVTSVGATRGFSPETAHNISAGGFSNIFPIPSYQKAAVESYLMQLGSNNAGSFNTSGRGFPDVSAQGSNIIIANAGEPVTIDGTSCSAPIFASLIAQVNALRIQANKSPLGFLNPLIYSNSQLFTDITSGHNDGCNACGFPAISGWDAVTGMGTPIFEAFQQLP